jgi:hypothetical protein
MYLKALKVDAIAGVQHSQWQKQVTSLSCYALNFAINFPHPSFIKTGTSMVLDHLWGQL